MSKKSSAQIEMIIALPLDVIADKLLRIEQELRSLNIKVLSFEQERDCGSLNGAMGARLERIHDTLDAIRTRLSRLDADSQPTGYGTGSSADQALSSSKPRPDLDD